MGVCVWDGGGGGGEVDRGGTFEKLILSPDHRRLHIISPTQRFDYSCVTVYTFTPVPFFGGRGGCYRLFWLPQVVYFNSTLQKKSIK